MTISKLYLTIIRLRLSDYRSPLITEPEANNCFSINTQVIIPNTKRKSIVKHEKILFHQKRANNWQPVFFLSRWLSGDSPRIANQSERAILYNHVSISAKMQ